MKYIQAQTINGAIQPAAPIPADALAVQFDGTRYVVYEAGDTLPPAPAVSLVPSEVTMRQAQLAMLSVTEPDGSTLLDKVNALIAQQPRAAQVTWNASSSVQRGNPLVAQIGAALGLSSADLDQLFITADTL